MFCQQFCCHAARRRWNCCTFVLLSSRVTEAECLMKQLKISGTRYLKHFESIISYFWMRVTHLRFLFSSNQDSLFKIPLIFCWWWLAIGCLQMNVTLKKPAEVWVSEWRCLRQSDRRRQWTVKTHLLDEVAFTLDEPAQRGAGGPEPQPFNRKLRLTGPQTIRADDETWHIIRWNLPSHIQKTLASFKVIRALRSVLF